jgi:phospholipid/cholesterol/gamma-HCH transport system ATP-binding protein
VIRFHSVYKSYGNNPVLRGIDFHLARGETKIILGGSGSGKSTILKLILGLEMPDSGTILVEGNDITELSEIDLLPIRSKIGMVFQEGALFDSLNVGENVAYRLREKGGISESQIHSQISQLLGFVDMHNTMDKMPSELSGGMRKRAAIARALAGNPKIILYDEATAGLDPITSRVICELMIKLRDLEKVSSVFVTHHLEAAFQLAGEYAQKHTDGAVRFHRRDAAQGDVNTNFLVMEEGRIIAEGSEEEIRQNRNPYVRDLLD